MCKILAVNNHHEKMSGFKGCLRLGLLVCGLWISPTWGFLKSQACGVLYSAEDFGGETFNVTEGSSFSNLEGEYVRTDAAWNVTVSFQVEAGCTLNACNESYYDGECRDFKEGMTRLSEELFNNVMSVSCSCPRTCKCDDGYKIRKKSCARAYLSEGGCSSCEPYYMDLKPTQGGEFPESFETKVSSLMAREGCKLNVYEEPELVGEPIAVEAVVQNWTGSVASYECWCDLSENVTSPAPTERPIDYPSLIDIPDSLDEIRAMMQGDLANHPGLLAALKSNRGERSTRNAYILLLGTTGAGKSSSINMLFDNPNVTKVGSTVSVTKDINEFRIPIPIDELGIRNSELRVIDTPGLGDTEGLEKDARFLATLEEYLNAHEELNTRIPNVVLIFHKFTDNRFGGEGSNFVKMIRGFDSFRDRLTDKKYSNVIFVFSHFTRESKRIVKNPKSKLSQLKTVIEEYSKFPAPILLAVAENKAEEEELLMLNGYYKLPNGDYYPKNVFDRITQVTKGGGDNIGDAVIRSAFKNPDNFNISRIRFSLGTNKNNKIPKYFDILTAANYAVNKTEVSTKLAVAHESMDFELKERFPDALYYLQKSLNLENYQTAASLPRTTTGIVELISKLRKNDAILYLLKEAFGISPPVLKESFLTGYSYNVFKDRPLPVSPFDLGKLHNSDIGYKFPEMITCNVDYTNKDILYFFKTRSEYLEERIKSLNIGGKMSLESFTGVTKPGHNVFDQITSDDGIQTAPITAVREHRTFELVLNDKLTFTAEFKNAVKSLSPYSASDHESVDRWKSFFNEYGTHVVKSAYGGGAIEIEVKSSNKFSPEIQEVLLSYIQFAEDMSLGRFGNYSLDLEGVEHSLKFVGGDAKFHTADLTKLPLQEASDLLEKWQESLILNPAILTNEMRLLPISEVAKRLGPFSQNISSEIERASGLLFNSSLIYIPPVAASKNLPTEDRNRVEVLQTNHMFSTFMDKFTEQARLAEERNEKMMLQREEEQRRANELRERMLNAQIEQMKEQLALLLERKKHDEKLEKANAEQFKAEMRRVQEAQTAMLEEQKRQGELERDRSRLHMEEMNEQLKAMVERKKEEMEVEKAKAEQLIAEMRRAEAEQKAMLDEQKRQAELETERSRLQMEEMNAQLKAMLKNKRTKKEASRRKGEEMDRRFRRREKLKKAEQLAAARRQRQERRQEEAALRESQRRQEEEARRQRQRSQADCLRQGTFILMADFTEKPVELLEVGEMILDHKLNPVRVSGVLEKFLLSFSFHGFDNETFFFTDTHQLVGRNSEGDLQIYVKELNTTLEQNPLLSYLNVQALPERTQILRYNLASNSVLAEEVSVFTDPIRYPPTTVVFMILVEGESGTYFANGFACRHDIPPLERWPNTMAVLFALSSEPEVQVTRDLPYNLETLGKIEEIINGGYVRLQEILEKEEEEETEAVGVVPEGSSLSDQVLLGIFENPTYSAFVIGIYGKLGPVLALRLDEGEAAKEEMEIRRIQFVAYEGLKEYFSEAFASSF